jgi:exosome complex RNA-binding protein Rrp42 (RNase PH superfamily)
VFEEKSITATIRAKFCFDVLWRVRNVRLPLFPTLDVIYSLVSMPRSHVLSDPTAFEEPLMDVALTVIVDDREQLISTSESGAAISQETLLQCISRAKERASQLQKLL